MSSKKSVFSKNKEAKQKIIAKFGEHENDTGSPMVQIALMTERINYLSDHLKKNKKDKHSRRGLLKIVGSRRKMIKYLERTEKDPEKVKKFLAKIGMK
ncbi:MAG: 30S ribosomal protein S15 [Candidatus Dojkabacteria bacterium]